MDFDSLVDDSKNVQLKPTLNIDSDSKNFDELVDDSETYGSFGQQAITAIEAAGKGFAGPLVTGFEKALSESGVPGLTPEDQKLREETNPVTHGVSEFAGMVGGDLSGVGELGLLGKAAEGVTKGMELGRIAKPALKGALEMAGVGAGDEISNAINNDPDQTAQTMIAHVGLSSLLGAGGGALFGAISPLWLKEHAPAVEQHLQDFKNEVNPPQKYSSGILENLRKLKPEAKELTEIGARNGWPVLEGMASGSKEVQMAEDALLNGPPTVASNARRQEYQKAYDAVTKSLEDSTASTSNASETEVGNQLKESLQNKLNQTYEPIKSMYEEIEPYRQAIPVSDKSTGSLSRTIEKIIEEQGLVKGSDRYNFVKTFSEGIEGVDNLQKLKNFRTEVSRSAGPMTKDLAGAIAEKLDGVEERAIKRFSSTMKTGAAKDVINGIIEKAEAAKSGYRGFRETLSELGNALGKKKIYGPQNFMDFLENLNPQTLARRVFNENNTEFASYLSKNFPEEMGIIRDYQRGLLRSEAMKDGALSINKLTKSVMKMEPEMRKLLFSPEELRTIEDATKYLNSMPKAFNPSGTAHESAFRSFFEHPTGAAIANLRDFGIQSFIKAFGRVSPGAEKEAARLIPILGPKIADAENNPTAFQNAIKMLGSSIKGYAAIQKGADNLFKGETAQYADNNKKAEALDKRLQHLENNPNEMMNINGDLAHYLPNHSTSIASSSMNAVNYLNAQRPKSKQVGVLDSKIEPTKMEKAAFDRKLQIAQNPLYVLHHIKNSTILPSDVQTLNAIYPAYYKRMSQELMNSLNNHVSEGKNVPYRLRQSLSLFLGQPLDSTMQAQTIQHIQSMYAAKQQQSMPQPGGGSKKGSPSKLGKYAQSLQTPLQTAESRRAAE